MVALKTRRLFLKRSPCPKHFTAKDFALGNKVRIATAFGHKLLMNLVGTRLSELNSLASAPPCY